MQINSISINNNLNTQSCKRPSFKSVVPIRVYVDGLPTLDEKTIEKGIRQLYKAILHASSGNPTKTEFLKKVRDFFPPSGASPQKASITSSSVRQNYYLFTGKEAETLSKISDELGHIQKDAKCRIGTSQTYEVSLKKREYFNKIRQFVNSNSRLKDQNGTETELAIHTKSKGSPGSKNFALNLDKIEFVQKRPTYYNNGR